MEPRQPAQSQPGARPEEAADPLGIEPSALSQVREALALVDELLTGDKLQQIQRTLREAERMLLAETAQQTVDIELIKGWALLHTVEEAAKVYRVSESHLWALVGDGTVPSVQVGGVPYVPAKAFAERSSWSAHDDCQVDAKADA
jgi:hypothetical protein